MAKVVIDDDLVKEVLEKYPEMKRLSPTDLVDWAMRKTLRDP